MKISTLVTGFIFLGVLAPLAPASAQVAGSAGTNIGGGSGITPMNLSPPNITRPNISRAPAHQSGSVPVEHFADGILATQQAQQKAWETKMAERQKQEQARIDAEVAAAAQAAKAAQIAPAAGDSAIKSEPYQPSIFIVGFAKFANMLARLHNHKAADTP